MRMVKAVNYQQRDCCLGSKTTVAEQYQNTRKIQNNQQMSGNWQTEKTRLLSTLGDSFIYLNWHISKPK